MLCGNICVIGKYFFYYKNIQKTFIVGSIIRIHKKTVLIKSNKKTIQKVFSKIDERKFLRRGGETEGLADEIRPSVGSPLLSVFLEI